MLDRCLYCYNQNEEYVNDLIDGRDTFHLIHKYTICDNCLDKYFNGMSLDKAKKYLQNYIDKSIWGK